MVSMRLGEGGQPLPHVDGVVDRRQFLRERARRGAVVHLGCVDEGLTEQRAGTGNLLHQELAQVAKMLVGVDLSEVGIEALRAFVPGDYIVGDVEEMGSLPLPDRADLVIAAELIEHLGSPARFLTGLREYLVTSGATAIVTTPNAYSWEYETKFALGRREWVHPDHLCLFSPITLLHSLKEAGLRPIAFFAHSWQGEGSAVRSIVDRVLLRWNPLLAPGLVVEVQPEQ